MMTMAILSELPMVCLSVSEKEFLWVSMSVLLLVQMKANKLD